MISTVTDPQSQPPIRPEGSGGSTGPARPPTPATPSGPLYSLSPSDPATSADAGDGLELAAPRDDANTVNDGNRTNNALENSEPITNFMKYGAIRPPVTVLQQEFLEKYRAWREHAEPLDGMEKCGGGGGGGSGASPSHGGGGDDAVRMGHMATVRMVHARYHRSSGNPGHREEGSPLFEPRSPAAHERTSEHEEKVTVSDEDEEKVDCYSSPAAATVRERHHLEGLAGLMFRPGSKLAGSIEAPGGTKTHGDYDLVVMGEEEMDELGRPRGMLARHKFGGDEQCVFVKLSYVPIPDAVEKPSEEEEGEEEEEIIDDKAFNDNSDSLSNSVGSYPRKDEGEYESEIPTKNKVTIQIEYVDSGHKMRGLWDHDALRFEGTVSKLMDSQDEQNQIGETIISGLISGHHAYDDDSDRDDDHGLGPPRERNVLPPRPPPSSNNDRKTRWFSLSPCTPRHPRGVAPAARAEVGEGGGGIHPKEPARFPGTATPSKGRGEAGGEIANPGGRRALLEEVASDDSRRLTRHRARTDTLRRETLAKLVELGAVVDFAELARKRNAARRCDKWRRRFRALIPTSHLPRRLRGRRASAEVEKRRVQFHDQLAAISWRNLLDEASVQAEVTCAHFRRRTALLDGLTFASDEYKAQVMSDLRGGGLTLPGSHSEWDACIQSGRTVALGWSWFERGTWGCFTRSAVVGKQCVYLLFQMHSRLEANHKHLEKAYRGADARLTNMQLDRIRTGLHTKDCKGDTSDGSGRLCGICQCDMDEDKLKEKEVNPPVCLPCSHTFHWECIREWLHNNSQCPICRVDLHTL